MVLGQQDMCTPIRWLAIVATASTGLGIAGSGAYLGGGEGVYLLCIALAYSIVLPPLIFACSRIPSRRARFGCSIALMIPLASFFIANAWVALLTRVHAESMVPRIEVRAWNESADLSQEVWVDERTTLCVYRVTPWGARIGVWERGELIQVVDLERREEAYLVTGATWVHFQTSGGGMVWPNR